MLLWKSWFDLRLRFYYSLTVLLILLGIILSSYPLLNSIKDSLSQERIRLMLQDYPRYVDQVWFSGNAYIALLISAMVLGLGGILAEKGRSTLLITLSLPVKRWKWVVTHAGMTTLLTSVLVLFSTVGIVLGSLLIGKTYPLKSASLGFVGLTLTCIPWIGLSLLLNSIFHDDMRSSLIVFPAGVIGQQVMLIISPSLSRWCPLQLASPGIWQHAIPWEPILISVAIALGSTVLSAVKFAREEN